MTARELRDFLCGHANDDDVVILARDGEGDTFSPLDECTLGKYSASTSYDGAVDARSAKYGAPCVTLWPTN